MAKIKISTLARELNVALPTVISFLEEKGISIDPNPNTRIDENVADMLVSKFKPDREQKSRSAQLSHGRTATRPKAEPEKPAAAATQPAATDTDKPAGTSGPRILGKLDLDASGRPVIRKPAEETKPVEAPKMIKRT